MKPMYAIPFASAGASAVVFAAVALNTGVHGYRIDREHEPNAYFHPYQKPAPSKRIQNEDDIDHIRSVLGLTVSELAKYLGVSRQAIYGWKAGGLIRSHNVTKIDNLREATDVIANAETRISGLALRRKLPGGKTFLEAIASGDGGKETARTLVAMLSREAAQRTAVSARLTDKQQVGPSRIGRGMASLRERG